MVLSVERDRLHDAPERSSRDDEGEEQVESPLESRLRRARDWLTGRRR